MAAFLQRFISVIIVQTILISAAAAASDRWRTETVDNGVSLFHLSAGSLALDSRGNAHVVYGGDYLYYALFDETGWHHESIDSSYAGGNCLSVTADSLDRVHIVYCGVDGIYHVSNASGSWVSQLIESVADVDRSYIDAFMESASLTTDLLNNVHISYGDHIVYHGDVDTGLLKYATNATGSWITEVVGSIGGDTQGHSSTDSSIAVGPQNSIHISYYDTRKNELVYALKTSESWITERVDSNGDAGQHTSLVIDRSGNAHISYFNYSRLKYGTNRSGSWSIQTLDEGIVAEDFSVGTSLVMNSFDNIYIAYYIYHDGISDRFGYASNQSGSWEYLPLPGSGVSPSLALDHRDNLHLVYYDNVNSDIIYSTNADPSSPPSIPALLYPYPGQDGLGNTVEFIWQKSTDADGDSVTYDLQVCEDQGFTAGCITSEDIASGVNNNVYYAGMGSGLMLMGIVIAGGGRKRRKLALLLIVTAVTAGQFISCGNAKLPFKKSADEVSVTVSGLSTDTTYFWKVVADDNDGGRSESEVRSFSTR